MKNCISIISALVFSSVLLHCACASEIWVIVNEEGVAELQCSEEKSRELESFESLDREEIKKKLAILVGHFPFDREDFLMGLHDMLFFLGPSINPHAPITEMIVGNVENWKDAIYVLDRFFTDAPDSMSQLQFLQFRIIISGLLVQLDSSWMPYLERLLIELDQLEISEAFFDENYVPALITYLELKTYVYFALSLVDTKWIEKHELFVLSMESEGKKKYFPLDDTPLCKIDFVAQSRMALFCAKLKHIADGACNSDSLHVLQKEAVDLFMWYDETFRPMILLLYDNGSEEEKMSVSLEDFSKLFKYECLYLPFDFFAVGILYHIGEKTNNPFLPLEFISKILLDSGYCIEDDDLYTSILSSLKRRIGIDEHVDDDLGTQESEKFRTGVKVSQNQYHSSRMRPVRTLIVTLSKVLRALQR